MEAKYIFLARLAKNPPFHGLSRTLSFIKKVF